jgi:hypothetical protein
MGYVPKIEPGVIYYQECDWCGHYHPAGWDGDCKDDAERYSEEQLNEMHGENGWQLQIFAELVWEDDAKEIPHRFANAA